MISAPVEILQAIYLPTGNYFCKNDCLIRAVTSGTRCMWAPFSEASLGSAAGRWEGCGARHQESRCPLPSWPESPDLRSQERGHPFSKMGTVLCLHAMSLLFPRSYFRNGGVLCPCVDTYQLW